MILLFMNRILNYLNFKGAPELNIEANQKEIYEGDRLHLKCTVKSHIPVNITWSFDSKILEMIYSK